MTSLRSKKFARTRLSIAGALVATLQTRTLPDISVKALCAQAEVSEATFFNYFPHKRDVMTYLAHLWLLELGWHARSIAGQYSGLAAIDRLYAHSAKICARKPGFFMELLAWIARGGSLDEGIELSDFEKQIAFPELEGIESVQVKGIDKLLLPHLEAAIQKHELPENTLLPVVMGALLSTLFGVPMSQLQPDPSRIAAAYRQQLFLLWTGVRSSAQRD